MSTEALPTSGHRSFSLGKLKVEAKGAGFPGTTLSNCLTSFSGLRRRRRLGTHLLEEALQPQSPVEAALNLLQSLFEDIQNFLGGHVLLQSQSFPGLDEALLEKGGLGSDLVLSQGPRPQPPLCPHLHLGAESSEPQFCLLQDRE